MEYFRVGINTQNTNRIWAEALRKRNIQEFGRYDTFQPEVKFGPDTRLDFLITGPDQKPMYIEVKNCTLVQKGIAAFPDAVTLRGQKHIQTLRLVQEAGMRAALVFIVQRMDAQYFQPASWIDPEYASSFNPSCSA
jgi:sugar fermentation stimulation protein A